MKFFYQTDSQVLRVSGEKAATFLHGQLTNTISDLAENQGNYNLWLTLKGKVRADLFVIRRKDFCDVFIAQKFLRVFLDGLTKLARLSKCALELQEDFIIYHVVGHDAELDKFFAVFRTDRLGVTGIDAILKKSDQQKFCEFLKVKGFSEGSKEQVELLRVKNAVPCVGVDVTENHLPQEGRLDAALHFKKGCYLGQEVVARLHYRGHVNKILVRLVSAEKGFLSGDEIQDDQGKKVGVVTSAVFDERENQSYLLGYVPYKFQAKDTVFFVGAKKIVIR